MRRRFDPDLFVGSDMKITFIFFAVILAGCGTALSPHSFKPLAGVVPDKATAIKIAEAVWIPIYGGKELEREKPFHAELTGTVWQVSGTLPPDTKGGTAVAEISKIDGRILRISHGK
jgi:hypothetical protein